MNALIRNLAVGVAALGLSLPALASTTTPAAKPAVSAQKPHAHRKAHRKVAQTEKKAEEKKVEQKAETKPAAKPAEAKPAEKAAPAQPAPAPAK